MSDLPNKIVSLETELDLRSVFGSDKYEALRVQLETVSLNGVCTVDLIKTLLGTVHKLSKDVDLHKTDKASLKSQINPLHEYVGQPGGSLPSRFGPRANKEIADPLRWPRVGIQPGVMPQLQFLDLRILLHLRRNLLNEELLYTLHQLFLRAVICGWHFAVEMDCTCS
jgi:hypothetical protein